MERSRPERRLNIATRRFLKRVGVPVAGKRGAGDKAAPPDWFGWLGVAAMLLLPLARVGTANGGWSFPLLSLGEWLLLPLGAASLTMGLLSRGGLQGKKTLPLWMVAVIPAVLWLAAGGLAMLAGNVTPAGGDLFLSWVVHLVFPVMAFLPLLVQPEWRDRLMWALAAGLAVNAILIFWQARTAGIAPPDIGMLRFGGMLPNQYDYALMLGIAIPLLSAWHGGNIQRNRALAILFCTFLLPALALASCFSWAGIAALAVGLAVSWAAWRGPAWIMGVFLCFLAFGYGSSARTEQETNQRRLLAASFHESADNYRRALDTFEKRPLLGSGPESYLCEPAKGGEPMPWYAALLGGTGLLGLGLWLALLAELAARALGREGRRCLYFGGVLGGTAGLAVAGLWAEALPEGAGALVGLLLAFSILEEPERQPGRRQARTRAGDSRNANAAVSRIPLE